MRRWTETQTMLIATIIFLGVVGSLVWLRYVSPWAWDRPAVERRECAERAFGMANHECIRWRE